jgi:dodecin
MARVVKVIELLSQSPKSWEDAAQGAVNEASKTLRNIRSIYIKEMTAKWRTAKSATITSTLKSVSIWRPGAAANANARAGLAPRLMTRAFSAAARGTK